MSKNNIINILTLILITILILSFPVCSFSEGELETLIILKDTYTFEELKELDSGNLSIGLMNIKSRKPYTKELYYYSLNLGRKIGYKDLEKNRDGFEFLGDVFKDEITTINGEKQGITPVVEDLKGDFKDKKIKEKDIFLKTEILEELYEDNSIIVLKIKEDTSLIDLKKLIEYNSKKDRRIYLLPENSQDKEFLNLNKYFTPMGIIDKEPGILTSSSTKREGIIAIEDISADIKIKYGKNNVNNIGREIVKKPTTDIIERGKEVYRESIEMHYITFFFHGLFYMSQLLFLYKVIFKKKNKWIDRFLVFTNMNIITSFIPGLFRYNVFIYLILTIGFSFIFTYIIFKKNRDISKTLSIFYPILSIIVIFAPKLIYKSFMGYNNLIYGARFYGINNGMAAILLGSSIFLIDEISRRKKTIINKNFIIFILGLLNILLLSTKFGSNTGAFLTSIILFLLINYYYIKDESNNKNLVFILAIMSLGIIGLILYNMGKVNNTSHSINFIKRIKENGLYEFYYMASFKLKELIKLTLMPPFSIVLLSQGYILFKLYKRDKGVLLIILTGLVGYLINDTGYEFLIYLLNFSILKLYFNNNLRRNNID